MKTLDFLVREKVNAITGEKGRTELAEDLIKNNKVDELKEILKWFKISMYNEESLNKNVSENAILLNKYRMMFEEQVINSEKENF